jgi:hypothetical protein
LYIFASVLTTNVHAGQPWCGILGGGCKKRESIQIKTTSFLKWV